MSYYQKVLQPGETVRAMGRLHWLIYGRGGLCLLLGLAVALASAGQDGSSGRVMLIIAAALAVIGAVLLLGAWLRRISTEIVVTDKRVIHKRGLISRWTEEINISKVETVDVQQGLLGRLLGSGAVVIRGTGGSWEPLRPVDQPLALRNAIIVG